MGRGGRVVSRLAGRAGLRVGGGRGRERDRLRGRGVRAGCVRAGCSGAGADVGSLLTILPTSVPGWGSCVTKYGRAVLLRSSSSCYRCVWLELRSRSVLQVHQAAQSRL